MGRMWEEPTMSRKKILIIEDDVDARLALNVRLKACGHETYFAVDGVSAESEARKSEPDLLPMDLGLPASDGYTAMDRFRNMPQMALTPLVIVSGRDFRAHRERAPQAGAKVFLQKPVKSELLLRVIRKRLGEGVPTYSD
jgi:CheY-like chemotaxis protein